MYKANKRHLQPHLISNVNELPEKKRSQLEQSWAGVFYRDFFCRIKEETFAVLYAEQPSRPNVAVNWLVGFETLKAGFGWSDEESYDHFCFDLQVRYALGLRDLSEGDFDLRTLYYFRERLSHYNLEHGVNLLTKAFEDITDQQIAVLKVKTGRQRMDSTQIASNILDASRLQLLVEAVQRLHRVLSESDQQRYGELLAPYLQGPAGQYVYRIKGKEATDEHLQQIGHLIARLLDELQGNYIDTPAYQVLKRFFADNFKVENQQVYAKTNQELESGCLQSCDDLEATFRRKGHREYKGYVANVSETCDPENTVQLITQVQVAPNHVNDNQLLAAGLSDLKERTGVETLHTDGAFAGSIVDPLLQQYQVEQIQSGIHGREPNPSQFNLADFDLHLATDGTPEQITCPQGQTVAVAHSPQRVGYRADFDPTICQTCPFHLNQRCPVQPGKRHPDFRLTFLPSEMVVALRRRKMKASKQTTKNLRAAVEGTIRELKHPFPASKLPVRGLFRITVLMVSAAAMANVRRIQHYWKKIKQDERRMETLNQGANLAAEPALFSFSAVLRTLVSRLLPTLRFSTLIFSC
jgi:Transposase DDE domain